MNIKKNMKTDEVIQLKARYEELCNDYLRLFCDKHEFDYEDAKQNWVAGDVGGIVECGDFFVGLNVILTDINLDVKEDEFKEWYYYTLDATELGIHSPNYEHWIRGCPRVSKEGMKKIRQAKHELRVLIEQAKQELNTTEKLF